MTPKPLPTGELRKMLAAVKTRPWKCGRPDMTSYDAETGEPFKQVYEAADGGGPVLRGMGEDCHENAQLSTALVNHAEALLDAVEERDELKSSLSEMRKENERLRIALAHIAKGDVCIPGLASYYGGHAVRLASEALGVPYLGVPISEWSERLAPIVDAILEAEALAPQPSPKEE